MDNTQLPAEMFDRIWEASLEYNNSAPSVSPYIAWRAGAIEYALKLYLAQQEIAELKQWKREATEIFSPIIEYGQSKEAGIPLGKSIAETVLERCKNYDVAMQIIKEAEDFIKGIVAFMGQTEKSENLLTAIKTFLDETK